MSSKAVSYGAEELERGYSKSAAISFLSALLLTLGAALYPLIKEALKEDPSETIPVKAKRVINYSELSAPPPIDLKKPEPEITKAQPVVKTVKYLPPKPKKDELVPDEEELPTMEELEQTMIGTADVEGVDSISIDTRDAEVKSEPIVEEKEAEVFEFVEIMPEFPGGLEAFNAYLGENLKYPQIAKEAQIQGRVYVSFVIEKDGAITNIEVLRGVHPALDEEAVRVISRMPAWNPGRQNQREVRVKFTLPISFVLK